MKVIQCKQCYYVFAETRTHCPVCGCALLPQGKMVNVDTLRLIAPRKSYRSVSKWNDKVSAR